jgi:hypothetical protein
MARGQKVALEALKRVSSETTELFERLANVSERATDRSSEVLVGVAGGAISLLMTYSVSVALPVVSFGLLGPIGACVGLSVGILAWRGSRRFRIERESTETRLKIEADITANRLKADEVMKRLKALPKDAPKQLRDALYLEYLALTSALGAQTHSPSGDASPPPLALSPPNQQPLALPPPIPNEAEGKVKETLSRKRRPKLSDLE